MARAVDVLQATWPGFQRGHLDTFLNWAYRILLPQMDYYVDKLNPGLMQARARGWICTVLLRVFGGRAAPRARRAKHHRLPPPAAAAGAQGKSQARKTLWWGNWAASVADAMMAVGGLGDDRWRYERGAALYRATVDAYFRRARGARVPALMACWGFGRRAGARRKKPVA